MRRNPSPELLSTPVLLRGLDVDPRLLRNVLAQSPGICLVCKKPYRAGDRVKRYGLASEGWAHRKCYLPPQAP